MEYQKILFVVRRGGKSIQSAALVGAKDDWSPSRFSSEEMYHFQKCTGDKDTIVRRGFRPGVTAVQLRLHPLVVVALSVWKKMSTVLVFEVKIGGRKYWG